MFPYVVSPHSSLFPSYLVNHTYLTIFPTCLPLFSPSQVATFAAGCFWGVEHILLKHWPINENKAILVGYTGGDPHVANPTYHQVCSGNTNHTEGHRIEFDPTKVAHHELVEYFYRTHDPTTLNSQGVDRGIQYCFAIFFHTPEQETIARRVTQEVREKHFTPKDQKIHNNRGSGALVRCR